MAKRAAKKADETKIEPQMDKIKVRLDIGHETIWLTKFDVAGCPLTTYQVSPSDVAAAFNKFGVSTGLLAVDTLFWENNAGEIRLGIYSPPQRRTIRLIAGKRAETLRVPMPGFVWVGQGRSYWIWAVSHRPQSVCDMMHVAPLPNVYSDGSICFGNVKVPVCKPDTIGTALEMFFASDFNFHLAEGKIRDKSDGESDEQDLLAFLRQLSKNDAEDFPLDALISPMPALNMGQVIRGQR